MVICTNSGVTITNCSNILIASDDKTYTISGQMLLCGSKIISYNCRSKEEALGTVVGLYGGRRF